jgi:arylsulfatase A-like enzyme
MSTADRNNDGNISNIELYDVLDPNDPDANDYVFDNFAWDHCGRATHAFDNMPTATGNAGEQLHDLATDPYESTDISANNTEAVEIFQHLAALFQSKVVTAVLAEGYDDIRSEVWSEAAAVVPWLSNAASRDVERIYYSERAPNIVFFLVDDWGINDPGYLSTYLPFTTPHIDSLANKGIKLSSYYSHELCVPSRAALITGRYASRFGMQTANGNEYELPLEEVTLAEELKSAGYRTYLIGKWHLGFSSPATTPTYRGFDRFYGYLGGYIDPWTKTYGDYVDLHDDNEIVSSSEDLDENLHTAELFVKKTEEILAQHVAHHADYPMFLLIASSLMHIPWDAPDRFKERCSANPMYFEDEVTYCALNILLDEVVANTSCLLEKYALTSNTLFIMASDNGGTGEMTGANYPYRGAKGSVLEGGVKVPAFIVGDMIPAALQGTAFDGLLHVTGIGGGSGSGTVF